MNLKQLAAATAFAASLMIAPPATAQLAEGVAAVVNDSVISTFDVRQRAILLLVSAGLQQTPDMLDRARSQALHDLIDEHLQLQEAEKFHINVTPDQIDRRMADIAQQNHLAPDALSNQLTSQGVSIATLRNQVHADLAWQRLISGMYSSRVRVSEDEIHATQDRIAANAARPQYLISEIFLPAENEQEFSQMQSGAMHLLEQMEHGAPFPMVARQFSQAPSAATGGDIGWIASTELAPELQPVAAQLHAGQVSLPIRTATGVYIIAMRDRHDGAIAGSTTTLSLREISAPAARSNALARVQRRVHGCSDLDHLITGVDGANVVDLGSTPESNLSPAIHDRIANVAPGAASPVATDGDQASIVVVCSRETAGGGVPGHDEVEDRLRGQELTMLAQRYLRNLRRDATIIARQ